MITQTIQIEPLGARKAPRPRFGTIWEVSHRRRAVWELFFDKPPTDGGLPNLQNNAARKGDVLRAFSDKNESKKTRPENKGVQTTFEEENACLKCHATVRIQFFIKAATKPRV